MPHFNKATIIPIPSAVATMKADESPISILPEQDVYFVNIENWLTPQNFELWRDFVSERERKSLAAARFALIHRFFSSGHIGREEQESRDLLNRVSACLHIIRPTRERDTIIQFRFQEDGIPDVFSFSHAQSQPTNAPQSALLNTIRPEDLRMLALLIPRFLGLLSGPGERFMRAVRYFHTAFTQIENPVVQLITWVAGIETLLPSEEIYSASATTSRLFSYMSPDWNIYEEDAFQEYLNVRVLAGDVAADMFRLRDDLVHGQWIPAEWNKRNARPAISGSIEYADMMREAAAAILRKLLMISMESPRLGFHE